MKWQWVHSRFILQRGIYTAIVRPSMTGFWTAQVEHNQVIDVDGRFPTRESAQAWCLVELAKLHRAGDCDEVA
jgi:hypothetical protein